MRCPACEVQNPSDATQCTACGKSLTRRPRRRGSTDDPDAPPNPDVQRCNAAALFAYRVCLFALVPGLGLILGPLSCLLGVIARTRGKRTPGFTSKGLTTATLMLGGAITATQWAGVALMVAGWHVAP
jgi:hypothetical protein